MELAFSFEKVQAVADFSFNTSPSRSGLISPQPFVLLIGAGQETNLKEAFEGELDWNRQIIVHEFFTSHLGQ